jgi:hypothetical protein
MAQSSGSFKRRRTVRGDIVVDYLMLKEAFRGTIGVNSFAGMVFATVVLARELHRIGAPLGKLRPKPKRPTVVGTTMAVAVARESMRGVAGERVTQTRFAGTMIGLSLLAPAIRRISAATAAMAHMFRAALRGIRAALLP